MKTVVLLNMLDHGLAILRISRLIYDSLLIEQRAF